MRPKHSKSIISQFYFEYLLHLLCFLFCFVFLAFFFLCFVNQGHSNVFLAPYFFKNYQVPHPHSHPNPKMHPYFIDFSWKHAIVSSGSNRFWKIVWSSFCNAWSMSMCQLKRQLRECLVHALKNMCFVV